MSRDPVLERTEFSAKLLDVAVNDLENARSDLNGTGMYDPELLTPEELLYFKQEIKQIREDLQDTMSQSQKIEELIETWRR